MGSNERPLVLKNAPLAYAPTNELGVVFLFADVAHKLQLRVEEVRSQFPDCIAYRRTGDAEALVRIEFEFRSSNFAAHGHDAAQCDAIVCWHHDWPDVPSHLEVIELKRYFGVARKVWIQQAIKSQWEYLEESDLQDWQLSKDATPGDVVLMYRCAPVSAITDVFIFSGDGVWRSNSAGWRDGGCYGGEISRLCRLHSPLFLDDMRRHKIVGTASFVRRNMQGTSLLATEYWPYLYEMILERNPGVARQLKDIRPDRL